MNYKYLDAKAAPPNIIVSPIITGINMISNLRGYY